MKFHLKRGHFLHKDGHHHLKRKHHHIKGKNFKLMRSMFDDGEHPCKSKFFGGLRKKSMMAGRHHGIYKKKHFNGIRGHSSSESDDDDHHHNGHHRHHMRGKHMPGSGDHHSKEDRCIRDSIGNHHKRMRMGDRCISAVEEGHHGRGRHFRGGHGMSHAEEDHHGRGNHFRDMHRHGMSDVEEGRHGRRSHFWGRRRHGMSDVEEDHHDRGNHFKGMEGRCMSEGPQGPENHFKRMERRCMSEGPHGPGNHHEHMGCISEGHHGPRKHHHMGGRCMSQGPHGFGKHFKSIRGRSMSDSDDDHHEKGRHMRGMMHHHRGKHGKRGHGKRGFFDDDSALVPICAMAGNNNPETPGNGNTCDQPTMTEEAVEERGGTSRDQGTQTTGIMEIVIEDQEALSAAIRIVNKFL